jgi:hypothetical protein
MIYKTKKAKDLTIKTEVNTGIRRNTTEVNTGISRNTNLTEN